MSFYTPQFFPSKFTRIKKGPTEIWGFHPVCEDETRTLTYSFYLHLELTSELYIRSFPDGNFTKRKNISQHETSFFPFHLGVDPGNIDVQDPFPYFEVTNNPLDHGFRHYELHKLNCKRSYKEGRSLLCSHYSFVR